MSLVTSAMLPPSVNTQFLHEDDVPRRAAPRRASATPDHHNQSMPCPRVGGVYRRCRLPQRLRRVPKIPDPVHLPIRPLQHHRISLRLGPFIRLGYALTARAGSQRSWATCAAVRLDMVGKVLCPACGAPPGPASLRPAFRAGGRKSRARQRSTVISVEGAQP
jgi:hypothetical protein